MSGTSATNPGSASGLSEDTVSTAADQFQLAVRVLQLPVFRQIVALPQAQLPAAGVVYNVNSGLGHLGIDGIKTGSTPQAGGCLVFSAERRVADLAAEGLSNRQIAQHLFITQPTVETHLRHVFQKLGITARADLPAQLAAGAAGAPSS